MGRWLRAAFVLRPFVVEGTQEPWVTVVNPQNIFQSEASLGKFSSPQLATLDTLPLPEDLAQLAETALALALNERHLYNEAAHNNLGSALDAKGQHDAAIAEFKEAIRLKPDNAAAHYNLGFALNADGQRDAAIAEFKEALRPKPDYAAPHNNGLCA